MTILNQSVRALLTYFDSNDTPQNLPADANGLLIKQESDYLEQVSLGLIPGRRIFSGFGEHTGVNGNNLDLWGGVAGIQPEPDTAGYQLWMVSSSQADNGTSATGALTGEAHYLNTAGEEKTVRVTLNGTTAVNTGVTDCMFVQEHHVPDVGSGLVSAGNVDCTKGSGGAIVSRVTALGNQSMSTMRQVPAGKVLCIHNWHGYGTAGTTKIANLRIRSSDNHGVLNPGVYHFRDSARLKDFATGSIPLFYCVPALATAKVSAWTTGAIDLTAKWIGVLKDL